MADRKFFRTAFRGFSREDVLNHIDTLHAEQQAELNDMQEQVKRAQEQCDAARAEAAAAASLPAEQLEELEQLRIKVAAYEQEIEELRRQAEECNQTLSAMWEQQRQLQQCVAAAQEFSADVYALSKDLYERTEAYTRQQFGEETVDALSEDVPTQETPAEEAAEEKADAPAETASNASDGNMERWLF